MKKKILILIKNLTNYISIFKNYIEMKIIKICTISLKNKMMMNGQNWLNLMLCFIKKKLNKKKSDK